MKYSSYYIMGIIGTLLIFYNAILIIGIINQKGVLMLSSGFLSILALVTLIFFKRAKNMAAAFFLIVAIVNFIINNSILTALIPAFLGITIALDRKTNV